MNRWVILCGGGGKGRTQAGELDALHGAGLLDGIKGIVGTSVGGINACLLGLGLAQGVGTKIMLDAWAAIKRDEDVYLPGLTELSKAPLQHPLDDLGLAKGFLAGPAPCSTAPLDDLARRILGGMNTIGIEQVTGLKILVRALNYDTHQVDTLFGDLTAMALCTSAIEGVFPRRWGYGDGGAVDNAPIDVALNEGADQILVVYCGPENPPAGQRPKVAVADVQDSRPPSTGLKDALAVLEGITQANEDLVDQAAARAEAQGVEIIHCFPTFDTGSALDFSPRDLLERGRVEAQRAIQEAIEKGWIPAPPAIPS